VEAVRLLLERRGIDPDKADKGGRAHVSRAHMNRHQGVLGLMKDQGPGHQGKVAQTPDQSLDNEAEAELSDGSGTITPRKHTYQLDSSSEFSYALEDQPANEQTMAQPSHHRGGLPYTTPPSPSPTIRSQKPRPISPMGACQIPAPTHPSIIL